MNNQSSKCHRQHPWPALKWTGLAVAIGATSLALAQQQSAQPATAREPASFLAEELDEVAAAVVAIDSAKRLISLESDDGREFTVEAGEDVRNFSQIEVGDEVNVQYYQALAAEVTKAETSSEEDAVLLEARAAEGDKPAGASGMLYTAIVTIDSVDTATNTVSFTGPEGNQRETTVERAEAREFIAQLKPGDRVQLTYGEALAVAVVPTTEERVLR
jgi:hypothetical protein